MLKITETKLPKETFGQKVNLSLLAQAVYVQNYRSHIGLRNTKTRSEVDRTTKKVYKQKGTGGARHGSRRANIFVGGGVIFGPRPFRRRLKLSFNIARLAKIAAFSAKAKEGKVMVVSGLGKVEKTKEIGEFIKKLGGKRITFLLSEKSKNSFKYFRNIKNISALYYKDASALNILDGGTILIDDDVFESVKVKTTVRTKKGEKSGT